MLKPCCFLLGVLLIFQVGYSQPGSIQELTRLYEYDRHLPLDIRDTVIQERDGLTLHDLSYASPKGGRVTAYLVVPAGNQKSAGMIFGHWGYGTKTEFLSEAMLYAEAGAVSLLIDYPWVRPAPWRKNVPNFSQPETDRDIYIQTVIDLRRGIDLLLSLPFVDSARIAYIGHSYGAQWGAILSAIDKRLKAVVLIGGVPSQGDIFLASNDPDFEEFRKNLPQEQLDNYLRVTGVLDAIRYVPYSAPIPLLFQFARYERYFGETSMLRYAQAAAQPKQVKWYNTGHELNDVQALIDRGEWLREHINIEPLAPLLESIFKK
jgi:pimeloyl-ACP methyl ester carboxylesterase